MCWISLFCIVVQRILVYGFVLYGIQVCCVVLSYIVLFWCVRCGFVLCCVVRVVVNGGEWYGMSLRGLALHSL